MRRLILPLLVSLILAAGITGCSSHPLTGLSVGLVKLDRNAGGSISATIQVVNNTVVAFNIASSRHHLLLNGKEVGIIEIKEPLGLPAQQNMTQTGPLKLSGGDLSPGSASYQLNSEIKFVLSGDKFEMQKMTNTGTVQVP